MCVHFYAAKKLSLLVTQLLTAEEDAALCDYLKEHPSLCCLELLVMFHLQRSRYIDAIRTNAQLNERIRTLHDPQVWERSATRNAIVDGFARALPPCLSNLANQPTQPPRTPSLPVPCMCIDVVMLLYGLVTILLHNIYTPPCSTHDCLICSFYSPPTAHVHCCSS